MSFQTEYVADSNQSGTSGTTVRPTTDSEVIVNQQDDEWDYDYNSGSSNSSSSGGVSYGWLDQLGSIAINALGQYTQAYVDSKTEEQFGNPGGDNAGDPFDSPGNTRPGQTMPFYEKYKKELLLGGAAAVGIFALMKLV